LSEEKKYKNYTAADIEKYYRGLLSPGEMNELEKAALDDPFLADALEGYQATAENISSDLSELEKKLDERVSDKKVISIAPSGTSFKWWKVAAAVVILGGLGYFIFQVSTGNKNKEVAITTEEKKLNEPVSRIKADSNRSITVESTSVARTDKLVETTTKPNPEKKKTATPDLETEADKNDVAGEITKPSQPNSTYKMPSDSLTFDRSSGVKAPAAMKERSVAADDKQNEGYISSKKDDASSNRQKANYFTGRIKDANNNPLPFANITNTRDNVGTYADAQGRFTLVSPDSVLNVQVRSVGFENSMVQLKNSVTGNDVVLQEDKTTPDKVLSVQKPDTSRSRMANMKFEELEPADGWGNYNTYLANNINVPGDLKRKEDVNGQVQLSFEVNQQGAPINIRVEKSLCTKCDEEAIRVVKQGPKWKKKHKKAKRITISVPFDTEQ
jgi:TonB family protein